MSSNCLKTDVFKSIRGVVTVFLGTLFLLSMPVCWAGAADKPPIQKRVVIDAKAPGVVIVNGAYYAVTDATLILDILGKEIPLCDLPVPCEADLEYQETEGPDFLCLVIEIRRLLTGADTQGTSGGKD